MGSPRIGFPVFLVFSVEKSHLNAWSVRWHTVKHPFNADVLIDIRPVNSLSVADDSPLHALSGSRL